ncbi:MAG: hypothetical protein WKF96_01210 [Solirubrobacteraceae bacterium]
MTPPLSDQGDPRPYLGPRCMLTHKQAARVLDALHGHRDPLAAAIRAKCVAALEADPKFGAPTT